MEKEFAWRDCDGKRKAHFMLIQEPLSKAACGFLYAPRSIRETETRERCQECARIAYKLGFSR